MESYISNFILTINNSFRCTINVTDFGYSLKICDSGETKMFEGWTNNIGHFWYGISHKSNPFDIIGFFMNNNSLNNFYTYYDEGFKLGIFLKIF